MDDKNDKLAVTVDKTIEALARIERFIEKYGQELSGAQVREITSKLSEVQEKAAKLGK